MAKGGSRLCYSAAEGAEAKGANRFAGVPGSVAVWSSGMGGALGLAVVMPMLAVRLELVRMLASRPLYGLCTAHGHAQIAMAC